MNKPTHKYTFTVNAVEADYNEKLRLNSLFAHIGESAMEHSELLNLSNSKLEEKDVFWVINSLEIHFIEDILWHQTVEITTWPAKIDRLFFYRDFEIRVNNNIVATASSKWMLIHHNSRRPARPSIVSDLYLFNETEPQYKIDNVDIINNFSDTNKNINIEYCDLDLNKHVNFSNYIKFILNSFDTNFMNNKSIKQLKIEYHKEIYLDENVNIYKEEISENNYLFELRTSTAKTANCKAQLSLR